MRDAVKEFFASIPKFEGTPEELEEARKKDREEEIEFYRNRNEKGYAI